MLQLPTAETPIRDALEYYVQTVSPRKRSYDSEVYRVRTLQDLLGDLRLDEVAPMHVVSFREMRLATPLKRDPNRLLATSTVKAEMMLLSHLYSTAISEWGLDQLVNPVAKIRKPKAPPGRTRRLTAYEEKKLLREAARHSNPEFYAIVAIALQTGMRQGEVLGLLWENVDWDRRIVHLPRTKNGEPRDVPLSIAAYTIFKDYLTRQASGKLFSYSSAGLKSSWRVFVKNLGLEDLHFHDLRHCAISNFLEKGLNTIEVASISGHKSMSMLKRYSHLHTWKLVEKLDPKRKPKKERPILKESLPAYPAIVTQWSRRIEVEFPDFLDLRVLGTPSVDTVGQAKDRLLRRLITMLCNGNELPSPTPVDVITVRNRSRVEMISPL